MSKATSPADDMALRLADQCRRVTLREQYDRLAEVAVDLHLVANDGSGERYHDGRTDRDRARQGYRAELAVAQHYGLRPEVDYRPPGVGDPGRDFWARYEGHNNDDPVTIDVKATTTSPPKLYLTKKRAWHDRYTLPDYYLLASGALTDDDTIHLVGWASCDRVQAGTETTVFDNPVWVVDGTYLAPPPTRSELSDIAEPERLKNDADRIADTDT